MDTARIPIPSIGYQILGVCISSIIFSSIALGLRIWARAVPKTITFWWDDYFAGLAWLFGVGNCALSIYWEKIGLGKHLTDVLASGTTAAQILIPVFAEDFLYNTGITFVKLSALSFYARIFRILPGFQVALRIVIFLVISWWITFTVTAICTCNPVQKQWDSSIPGTCLDQQTTFIAAATPNVAIDLAILLLPMPLLWPLQMTLRRRLALVVLFTMGYCTMIVSIVRLVTVIQYQKIGGADFSWNWTKPQVLVLLEVPLGVTSVCLPTIFQLARRAFNNGWLSILRTGRLGPRYGTSLSPHAPIADNEEESDRSNLTSDSENHKFAASLGRNYVNRGTAFSTEGSLSAAFPMEQIRVKVDVDVSQDRRGTT